MKVERIEDPLSDRDGAGAGAWADDDFEAY
jgi:hypothetical protein